MRPLPHFLLALALALAVVIVGCSDTGTADTTVVITIDNLRFAPAEITIDAGTTVRWVNDDTTAHTSTSKDFKMDGPNGPQEWNSKPLNPGQSWERTFKDAGDFDYFCMVHPYMKGVIHVRKGQ